jgi:hypothetical protein
MTTRTGSLPIARVLMAGVLACTAGCTTIAASGSNTREKYADRRAGAACFYSDVSGADRVRGYRVLHWCGPEPKALF